MALPVGWTNDAILEEILVGPWQVPSPLADTQTIDSADWRQRLTPSLPQGGMNDIGLSRMDARDADAIIDRTIAAYAGIRFRWSVVPGSSPPDLADRLAARGFSRVEIRGMARDLAPLDVALPEGTSVERVGPSTVDEFTTVMAEGWSMDPGPLIQMHRSMVEGPGDHYRLFLVRQGKAAVAAGGYSAAPRSAYQMGAVVLPAFRKRGYYPALVAARLADSAARGLSLATSQARDETSAPILERLGFVTVCRFPSFSSPPG